MDFCCSGLTINGALQKITTNQVFLEKNYKYALVNLGAIDILLERNITDIQADYVRLISKLENLKIRPIITTIPKIKTNAPNELKQFLSKVLPISVNDFIIHEYCNKYLTIDFWNVLDGQSRDPHKQAENYELYVCILLFSI